MGTTTPASILRDLTNLAQRARDNQIPDSFANRRALGAANRARGARNGLFPHDLLPDVQRHQVPAVHGTASAQRGFDDAEDLRLICRLCD